MNPPSMMLQDLWGLLMTCGWKVSCPVGIVDSNIKVPFFWRSMQLNHWIRLIIDFQSLWSRGVSITAWYLAASFGGDWYSFFTCSIALSRALNFASLNVVPCTNLLLSSHISLCNEMLISISWLSHCGGFQLFCLFLMGIFCYNLCYKPLFVAVAMKEVVPSNDILMYSGVI